MYRIGEAEVARVRKLIESGRMFRYGKGGECDRFERDWGKHVGVPYVRMTRRGTGAQRGWGWAGGRVIRWWCLPTPIWLPPWRWWAPAPSP